MYDAFQVLFIYYKFTVEPVGERILIFGQRLTKL